MGDELFTLWLAIYLDIDRYDLCRCAGTNDTAADRDSRVWHWAEANYPALTDAWTVAAQR